jgi:hypothetical protein
VSKLVLTMMAVLSLAVPVRRSFAAGEETAPAAPPDAAPAVRAAPAPGSTRFITRGAETVEGRIIDRLPNGYLVRLANDTTRVVVYEDVASIEGSPPPAAPQPAPAPPPPAAYPQQMVVPVALSPGYPAEPAERFGRAGQIIITQSFGYVSHAENTTTIGLSPAIDFLVTRMLTIGFDVGYTRSSTTTTIGTGETGRSSTSTSSFVSVSLKLGLVIPLADTVSLWPIISGGIEHDFDGKGSSASVSETQLALLIHPIRHFFVAVGPFVRGRRSLEGSGQTVHYTEGLGTGIGGWW